MAQASNNKKKDRRSPQRKEWDNKRKLFENAKENGPTNGKEAAERAFRKFQRQGKPNDGKKTSNKDNANDPSWYIRNDVLAKNVASFSFNNALGAEAVIQAERDGGDAVHPDLVWRAPGIMVLNMAPSAGVSTSETSPMNIAAKNVYTWVRHQNSGHANYDSPDLMLYILAMDSVYSIISWWSRILGVARVFSQTNRYVGDAMLKAMGVDPLEVRANIAQIRGWLNMYITKASAFCVPNTMSYYVRHYWMYSNIFKDEDVVKSQFYMYNPAVIFNYEETSGGPGYLHAVEYGCTPSTNYIQPTTRTLSQWQLIAELTLQKLQASEDINIMSGDILKAFGRENLWTMGLVPDDYVTMPIFSEEVLDQIHNTRFASNTPAVVLDMTAVDYTPDISTFDIIQDPSIGSGNLLCHPKFLTGTHLSYQSMIDINEEEPSPERVMVATRNAIIGASSIGQRSSDGSDIDVEVLTSCGSEIPLFATLYMYDFVTKAIRSDDIYAKGASLATGNAAPFMTQFNKRPIAYQMSSNFSPQATIQSVQGEIDNYTILSHGDIKKVHESALLSMFGVPFYGISGK